jgi:predicted Rossmann fold nucleotide-binding protein DprA/Smf involved in DNA uptake
MFVLEKSPEALSIVKDAIVDPILQYCIQPKSIDEIADHLEIDITQAQTKVLDMYLENKLQETEDGR